MSAQSQQRQWKMRFILLISATATASSASTHPFSVDKSNDSGIRGFSGIERRAGEDEYVNFSDGAQKALRRRMGSRNKKKSGSRSSSKKNDSNQKSPNSGVEKEKPDTTTPENPLPQLEKPESNTKISPPCPSVYDPYKTSYVSGDQVTVKCQIFQCRDKEHEPYCNTAVWHNSLLAQNGGAKELWTNAWEKLGACEPTLKELMEVEASDASWVCLVTNTETVKVEEYANEAATTTAGTASTVIVTNPPTTSAPTTKPTDKPTNDPTMQPITNVPTSLPTKNRTSTPTKKPVENPVPESEVEEKTAGLPTCPPRYWPLTTYTAGDIIENNSQIYKCQASPYEKYCNIIQLDKGWSDTKKQLWQDAWVYVSDCEKLAAGGESTTLDDYVADDQETVTTSTTTTTETAQVPSCPPAYDPRKTDYVSGDQITVKCDIFQCRDKQHEFYCNFAAWDDILLVKNAKAKEMWMNAWEQLGACAPTQAESANASWDCVVPETTKSLATEAPATTIEASSTMTTTRLTTSPTKLPTASPVTENPTKQPTNKPTPRPTKLPTKSPSKSPTSSPTKKPTGMPTISPVMDSTELPDVQKPLCPSAYDPSKSNYMAGDEITVMCDIFKCRDKEHEMYCNIAAWDNSLLEQNKGAKEMWMNAWEKLGACAPTLSELMEEEAGNVHWDCLVEKDEKTEVASVEATSTITDASTSLPTKSLTGSPTRNPTASPEAQVPVCPPVYDPYKTNYIAGDQIMVKCEIFQCRDNEHEMYCNIAAWNDSLLAQNKGAREMWMNAWEQMGSCEPTQEELMEVEASDVAWDCLA